MKRGSKLSSGTIYVIVILALVIAFSSTILGGVPTYDPTAEVTGPGANLTPIVQKSTVGQKNLQLQELQFATAPTPTPVIIPPTAIPVVYNPPPVAAPPPVVAPPSTSTCPELDKNLIAGPDCTCNEGNVTCQGGVATKVYEPAGFLNHPNNSVTETGSGIPPNVAKTCAGRKDGLYCEYKPVIYLYPTQNTVVNVRLHVAGTIVKSIPTYPENGWKNIFAEPNGTFTYKNETYHELFYEDSFNAMHAPQTGIVIPTADLSSQLALLTTRLGLLPSEQKEFLDFWLPKLSALKTSYILFSVFDRSQKEAMDKVDISPKPDTTIEFLAYFKPLQTPIIPLKPLVLPNPPARRGFTAVIWGGTIDTN